MFNIIVALLFINLVMVTIGISLIMFSVYSVTSTSDKNAGNVTRTINDKLDVIHNESAQVLNKQGNLTEQTRNQLIKNLEELPLIQQQNQAILNKSSEQIQALHDQNSKLDQGLLEIQDAVQCLQLHNTSVSCSHINK